MPILKPGASLKFAPPATNFIDRIRTGRVVPMRSDDARFDLMRNGNANFLAHLHRHGKPLAAPFHNRSNLIGPVIQHVWRDVGTIGPN